MIWNLLPDKSWIKKRKAYGQGGRNQIIYLKQVLSELKNGIMKDANF